MSNKDAKKIGATHVDKFGVFWDVKDEANIRRYSERFNCWFPYFYKLNTAKQRYKLKPL